MDVSRRVEWRVRVRRCVCVPARLARDPCVLSVMSRSFVPRASAALSRSFCATGSRTARSKPVFQRDWLAIRAFWAGRLAETPPFPPRASFAHTACVASLALLTSMTSLELPVSTSVTPEITGPLIGSSRKSKYSSAVDSRSLRFSL